VTNNPEERAAKARLAKLTLIREQVRSGELVIRQMTRGERQKWAEQHASVEANLTPAERRSREATLKTRRKTEARRLQLEERTRQVDMPTDVVNG